MNEVLNITGYEVIVGACADEIAQFVSQYSQRKIIVVTDSNTHIHCLDKLHAILPDSFIEISIPAGEIHKNVATCGLIWNQLLQNGVSRNDLMLNLGGGVIGDMGGFCASTFKRGIDFVQIPTTLLSMVDASIGGKLGIDFQGVKNSIGVFKNPKAVFIDPVFLKTLSFMELRSGFAEIIKHTLISDEASWNQIKEMNIRENVDWLPLMTASLKVKQQIVLEDPFEKGIRKALNFGHTIGHGIEGVRLEKENYLLHGEAIAIGMVVEAWLSVQKGFLSENVFGDIFAFLKETYDLQAIEDECFDECVTLMRNDKKNDGEQIRFSLIGPIGTVHHDVVFAEPLIKKALEKYNRLL
jgi:3-dehydroquinate synthase